MLKRNLILDTTCVMILLLAGCADSPDERLEDLARQSLGEQARQSERIAQQSRQIAQVARQLVEADAQARRDMIQAHAALERELAAQRARLDHQREDLERERRQLAGQRHRAPIIAQAIFASVGVLACLLPLLVAGYVLYTVNRDRDEVDELNRVLIGELVAKRPRLLPVCAPDAARLEHRTTGAS